MFDDNMKPIKLMIVALFASILLLLLKANNGTGMCEYRVYRGEKLIKREVKKCVLIYSYPEGDYLEKTVFRKEG